MDRPYIVLENHYGSHQPAVFCEQFEAELEEQGLSDKAEIIIRSDYLTDVLYYEEDKSELEGVDHAALSERASCAWMDILDKFVPEEGFHLGYMPDSQALWAIPDGYDPDEPYTDPNEYYD